MTGDRPRQPLRAAAQLLFLLLIASLAFMRPSLPLFGMAVVATDFIFLLLLTVWAAALARREAVLVWHRGFIAIAVYFAALAVSAAASGDPTRSLHKLLTQIYLVSLPVIACSLVTDRDGLRRSLCWWLWGSAIVAVLGAVSLILFALDPRHPWLVPMINEFGTLPPGHYPRLRLSYEYASLLCNYLTVSLMILLAARRMGWIGARPFELLLAGIGIAAAFSLTPGLGGFLLAGALWLWLTRREAVPWLGRAALVAGIGTGLAFLVAAAVTPIIHPTAPFLIHLPLGDTTVAPAVRMMTWIDAFRNFMSDPLLGRGIGRDAVSVFYQGPGGSMHHLTDAHNGFLNLAAQTGIVGLAAFVLLLGVVVRVTLPLRLQADAGNAVRLALGIALLDALAFQGLVGSFEDARYLWVALGLLLAADRIEEGGNVTPVSRGGARAHS